MNSSKEINMPQQEEYEDLHHVKEKSPEINQYEIEN